MIQEELQQRQIVIAEHLAKEEVVPQPAVDVLHDGTGSDGATANGFELFSEWKVTLAQDFSQPCVSMPTLGIFLVESQHGEQFSNQLWSDIEGIGQGGEVAVKLGNEFEQIVSFVFQIRDEGFDDVGSLGNACFEFGQDEGGQFETLGMAWARQSE